MRNEEKEKKREKKRKPYQKPALTAEELFEATVLNCTQKSPKTCAPGGELLLPNTTTLSLS